MIPNKIKEILENDEIIINSLKCSMKLFIYRKVNIPGILFATNRRLLFYMNDLIDNNITLIDYKNIKSIVCKNGLLKKSIIIKTTENIKFTDIVSNNPEEFVKIITEMI